MSRHHLAPLLLALLLACSDDGGDSAPDGDDNDPELTLDPELLDFGLIPYDGRTEVDGVVEVGNRGAGTLLLLDITLDGGEESPFTLSSIPTTTLRQGERIELGLQAMARAPGDATDVLRVLTNDPLRPEVEVTLRMASEGPGVAVSPSELELGSLELGCGASERVSISNYGTGPLEVNAVALNGGLGFALDLLPADNGSLPWSIGPGEQREVSLRFEPAVSGADSAELRVNSDDPLNDTVIIPIRGEAQAGELVEETVRMDGAVDVVFVVDDSSAAALYRAQLLVDLADLTEALSREDADYRITALYAEDGCIQGGDLYVDARDTTTAQKSALGLMLTGSSGALSGHGLALTELGLAATSGGCNAGVLRDGAAVAVIAVAAVDDLDTGSVSEAVDAIAATLPYPSQLRFNALGGALPSGCETASAGVRYERATELTGGAYGSICDNSYRSSFAAMAEAATEASVSFIPMSQAPVVSTLLVNVRGVDRSDGWTYDEAEQALRLDASLRVTAGDSVGLSYSPVPAGCE